MTTIVIYLIAYLLMLLTAFVGFSYIQGRTLSPLIQLGLYVIVILLVFSIHCILFGNIYYGIYKDNKSSFEASDMYSKRKRAIAVRSLWLSKDIKSDYYFPNWMPLELSDILSEPKDLNVFFKGYELFYGTDIDYGTLRKLLSRQYSELMVKIALKPLPRTVPRQGEIDNLPDVKEFTERLSSNLEPLGININYPDKGPSIRKNIAIALAILYQELGDYVSINRFDILLNIKSREIFSILGDLTKDKEYGQVKGAIEKTLFYHLSHRMTLKPDNIPVELGRLDFLYYSALSFFSASYGDIQPLSKTARVFTVIQVVASFIILALAIAFLSRAVENIDYASFQSTLSIIHHMFKPAIIAIITFIAAGYALSHMYSYFKHGTNRELLNTLDNYGYNVRMDGTVNLMINLSSSALGGDVTFDKDLKVLITAMPYQSSPEVFGRYPGILVTEDTAKIVWAELLPLTTNRLYIYGDNYNLNDIKGKYKILIPANYTVFNN